MARFRMGSEIEDSKYWKKEQERKCRLCGKKAENIEYILNKCQKQEKKERIGYSNQKMEEKKQQYEKNHGKESRQKRRKIKGRKYNTDRFQRIMKKTGGCIRIQRNKRKEEERKKR